ncbi:MAG: beta-glucosidase family protein [Erysipelotrichaceae bacterium]
MNVKEWLRTSTVEEKLQLLEGNGMWATHEVPALSLAPLTMNDGPHGIRKPLVVGDHLGIADAHPATCFPTASLLACSFDVELLEQVGTYMGKEAQSLGVDLILGPGVNIKRNVRCGRNFEYFSEDPLLSGLLGQAQIKGFQQGGADGCVKHFFGNNQETLRHTTSSQIDERAMQEIYLKPFALALQANPLAIMTSYNRVNHHYVSEDANWLQSYLRETLGYTGIAISDWGGVVHKVKTIQAGLQLEMPGTKGLQAKSALYAYRQGHLTIEQIDAALEPLLDAMVHVQKRRQAPVSFSHEVHHDFAKQVAAQSCVLLQNKGALPYVRTQKVLVLGGYAKEALIQGNGSSRINPTKQVSLLEVLDKQGIAYTYHDAYDVDANTCLLDEAQLCAWGAEHDQVLVVVGPRKQDISEGYDVATIELPLCQQTLLQKLHHPNITAIIMSGGVQHIADKAALNAIVYAGFGGQAIAEALFELLYGIRNFAGRLAQSWPESVDDDPSTPYFANDHKTIAYKESIFVGYRYYETFQKPVAYPFGFGLSYSNISLNNSALSHTHLQEKRPIHLEVVLQNDSTMDGAEVVQVYVEMPQSVVARPKRELKAFAKVHVPALSLAQTTLSLHQDALAVYHPNQGWVVEAGTYLVHIMRNAHEILATHEIQVEGERLIAQEIPACYQKGFDANNPISDAVFAQWHPTFLTLPRHKYTMDDCLYDMEHLTLVKPLLKWADGLLAKMLPQGAQEAEVQMMKHMMMSLPLKRLYLALDGKVSEQAFLWALAGINATSFKKARTRTRR